MQVPNTRQKPLNSGGAEDSAAPIPAADEDSSRSDGLTLASLVVWFKDFLHILEDGAVGGGGGGGDGSWGSRPSRLLKVIDQRVGCAQEAVQLVRDGGNVHEYLVMLTDGFCGHEFSCASSCTGVAREKNAPSSLPFAYMHVIIGITSSALLRNSVGMTSLAKRGKLCTFHSRSSVGHQPARFRYLYQFSSKILTFMTYIQPSDHSLSSARHCTPSASLAPSNFSF